MKAQFQFIQYRQGIGLRRDRLSGSLRKRRRKVFQLRLPGEAEFNVLINPGIWILHGRITETNPRVSERTIHKHIADIGSNCSDGSLDGRKWSIWKMLYNIQVEITFIPYRLEIEQLSNVDVVRIVGVSFGERRKISSWLVRNYG